MTAATIHCVILQSVYHKVISIDLVYFKDSAKVSNKQITGKFMLVILDINFFKKN